MAEKKNDNHLVEYMLTLLSLPQDIDRDSPIVHTAYKLRDFLDEIPGGFLIYRADKGEEIIFANKALMRIFGCETESQFRKITKNSFRGLVHPDDLEAVEKSIASQICGSAYDLDYVEYRIIRKDGQIRWIEDYGHYIYNKSIGNVFYVFLSDATEKVTRRFCEKADLINRAKSKDRQIENLVEEYDKERKLINQEHLRRLEVIEGLSVDYDSILYVDVENDNVVAYRVSDRTSGEFGDTGVCDYGGFISDYVGRWVYDEDKDSVRRALSRECLREKLSADDTYYLNYRCKTDSEIKYLQLRIVNVGRHGVSQVVIGCRNIDEEIRRSMRQREILEQALNKAELASIARNTFLSNISHDMRTPLNAIFGYTALAKKNLEIPETVKGYLEKIEEAGERILDQIEQVLQVSYLESKDDTACETEINIEDILKNVCDAVSSQARKKKITVKAQSALRHAAVRTDSEKLQRALGNLASNAVKYTGVGGRVEISVREEKERSDGFCEYVFAVSDNGVGISKSSLGKIFEPFVREKDTTQSGVFGVGLGLTIAKGIIENLGGEIAVESAEGKGSTFTVTVPLFALDAVVPPPAVAYDASNLHSSRRVLIVEDNELNLEIETEILGEMGFEVETAENGRKAVEMLCSSDSGHYDFIIMDIQMPVMHGWEASETIRKLTDPKLSEIPIIALSANAFESDKQMSAKAGMDAHLPKPINIPVLTETIERVLAARAGR